MSELFSALSSSCSSAEKTQSSSSALFFVARGVGERISSPSCKPPLTCCCGQPGTQAGGGLAKRSSGFLVNNEVKTEKTGRAGFPKNHATALTVLFQLKSCPSPPCISNLRSRGSLQANHRERLPNVSSEMKGLQSCSWCKKLPPQSFPAVGSPCFSLQLCSFLRFVSQNRSRGVHGYLGVALLMLVQVV